MDDLRRAGIAIKTPVAADLSAEQIMFIRDVIEQDVVESIATTLRATQEEEIAAGRILTGNGRES